MNVTENLKFVLGRVQNIVGKGENAAYQHFLLFPQCFQKASLLRSFKVRIVWLRVHYINIFCQKPAFNPLRNNEILSLSKLKAFVGEKFIRIENIGGKGENGDNKYFLLFPVFFFSRAFCPE